MGLRRGGQAAGSSSPPPAKDNWAAAGDMMREAWVDAGDEIRIAMGQVAAERKEISV